MAFAVIRVAQFQSACGHAMKAHHQQFFAAMALPVALDVVCQCSNIARVVVVVVDKAKLWHPTGA